MGWKFLAAASVSLFIISGLIYWFSVVSSYSIYIASGIDAFAASPSGEYFAVAYGEEVRLYSSNGDLEWSKSLSAAACAIAFSPSGGKLAVFAGDRLYFLSAGDGLLIREIALTLSCAPSSTIYWAPDGDAVLVNARGRLGYVTMAGRGEVTPYVGLTITRLRWLSGSEALAIDDFGDSAYLIAVVPLTVDTLAAYGGRGSAGFFGDGVFVIDEDGWVALIGPDGIAYNKSLGDSIAASGVSDLGFAVLGDKVLAIDPSNGGIVWEVGLGVAPSSAEVKACGKGAALKVARQVNITLVSEAHIFVDGEDILEKAGIPNNPDFLAWFGNCSAALVFDVTKPETYIVRVDGSVEPLGGVYSPVARVGDSLIAYRVEVSGKPGETYTVRPYVIGPFIIRPDGAVEPIMRIDYSTVYQISEKTVLAVGQGGAWIVKLGEAPPQYSWGWIVPALLGTGFGAGAVWAFLRESRWG